jgi:hypothetical protein
VLVQKAVSYGGEAAYQRCNRESEAPGCVSSASPRQIQNCRACRSTPTYRGYVKCGNGFRGKRKSQIGVLPDPSGCPATYKVSHRSRFAITAPSKRPTCRGYVKCSNGFRGKRKSSIIVLADRARSLGTYTAAHRSRSTMPRPLKRPTCRGYVKCENGFRAKETPQKRVLAGGSRCFGVYAATHRSGFTIAAFIETPNVPQNRQVRKGVSREGERRRYTF